MSGGLAIGLPEIVAGAIMMALTGYALTGGADYGGGVWDLLARGPRREDQRRLIAESIGPIWEANHVWLIVVVVVLFTGFPGAFSVLGTVLHVPITILLIGIVLRGSAFVFRSYGRAERKDRRAVGTRVFDRERRDAAVLRRRDRRDLERRGRSGGDARRDGRRVVHRGLRRAVAGCVPTDSRVLHAGVVRDAGCRVSRASPRGTTRSAMIFGDERLSRRLSSESLAGVSLLVSASSAPRIARGVTASPWAISLHTVTAIAAVTTIAALWWRRYRLARVAVGAQVTMILWGWALAQYPFVIPPTLTIRQSAAPDVTLELLLLGLAAGALILIPSLRLLFKTFSPAREASGRG